MHYVSSFAQDLVHAVSRGKFMTAKHILLGAGLHSLTGQKLPIKLLARYGNACTYEMVQKIETAQAELVQNMRLRNFPFDLVLAQQILPSLSFGGTTLTAKKKRQKEVFIHVTELPSKRCQTMRSLEKNWIQTHDFRPQNSKVANNSLPKRAIRPHKKPPSLPLELTRQTLNCSKKMLFL